MNKKEEITDVPDFSDEEFWEDFNDLLWNLVSESESSSDLNASAASGNVRKKDCFSFERCGEIAGQKAINLTIAEKSHLEDCRYCARRIAVFSEAAPFVETVEPIKKERSARAFSDLLKTLWQRRFELSFGLAALAVILTLGWLIFIVQFGTGVEKASVNSEEIMPESPSENKQPSNSQIKEITNTNVNLSGDENTNLNSNLFENANAKREKLPDESKENQKSDNSKIELAMLSSDERMVIRETLRTGKIPPSEDMKLLRSEIVRRGNKTLVSLISPKNAATLENPPTLRWETLADSEYRVIVSNQQFTEVANSGVLSQNSWKLNEKLPPAFYFWQVLVRKKDSAEFILSAEKGFFKIVGDDEKKRIEKAKSLSKSNLVGAILYARAGLFNEAERELMTELRKNPKSADARKILKQIRSRK